MRKLYSVVLAVILSGCAGSEVKAQKPQKNQWELYAITTERGTKTYNKTGEFSFELDNQSFFEVQTTSFTGSEDALLAKLHEMKKIETEGTKISQPKPRPFSGFEVLSMTDSMLVLELRVIFKPDPKFRTEQFERNWGDYQLIYKSPVSR